MTKQTPESIVWTDDMYTQAAETPEPFDADLENLVANFSKALLQKLYASEAKYNWQGGWKKDDWRDDLLKDIRKHVEKGDPRDVAAYAAFAWHHGWSLKDE